MLSDWIAEQQPTPEGRLVKFQDSEIIAEKRNREYAASMWRHSRKILYSLSFQERQKLVAEWNKSHLPKTYEYFADFLANNIPSVKETALKELEESTNNHHQSIKQLYTQ
ncbi:hypothetical protein CAL7716_102350 (plasmid) [Calothrix sp. PCC 7716]|nr:hypothetical protein CAL7716_102350 [Calothrix sp. PCC 7716]